MIRTLFIGSNWEALETLKRLDDDERFDIVGLITQPDKPVGRKHIVEESEIKRYATEKGIEVYHTLKEPDRYKEALDKFEPELIVCKSFGEIMPGFFVDHPKYKTINVHYSLLPKYRGAVPIQKAILEGESVTGISFVVMVEQMDAGPIIAQFEEEIRDDDTNQSLRERLVELTGEKIGDILEAWIKGEIKAKVQDDTDATYCWQKDISKEQAFIDFKEDDPELIERKVRALLPWPVAWCDLFGKRMKIYSTEIVHTNTKVLNKGEFGKSKDSFYVGTIDPKRLIKLNEVQLEGKRRMSGSELAHGYKIPSIQIS